MLNTLLNVVHDDDDPLPDLDTVSHELCTGYARLNEDMTDPAAQIAKYVLSAVCSIGSTDHRSWLQGGEKPPAGTEGRSQEQRRCGQRGGHSEEEVRSLLVPPLLSAAELI